MNEVELLKTDEMLSLKLGDYLLELPLTPSNQKMMLVLARAIRKQDSHRSCFTYQAISDALGHDSRQWSNNFCREFQAAQGDCLKFLQREYKLRDNYLESIHQQILEAPFLRLSEHHRLFLERYPKSGLPDATFRSYVSHINGVKLLQRVRSLVDVKELSLEHGYYLQQILERGFVSTVGRAEIESLFGQEEYVQQSHQAGLSENSSNFSQTRQQNQRESSPSLLEKARLACFLYAGGLSMQVLAMLFTVCKGTIHNWLYKFATVDLETQITESICRWSGRVSFDEKWVKLKGVWWYVFCAVDDVTGFPLLLRLYPSNDGLSWQLFFTEFKALYGVPRLIISDGSTSLAAGRKKVFFGVVHQLCKFHKLRNLFKRLFGHIKEKKLLKRCIRLAKNIFSNGYVSSRKHAARTLSRIAPEKVKEYVAFL